MSPSVLRTEQETQAWGRWRGEEMQAGDVIALVGGLGAGKTQVAKGLAAGLGFSGEVTSPTFPLVHEYFGGRLPMFHFDFYRIDHAGEVLRLGWEEYLESEGVCIVEWADKFPELLPPRTEWWRLSEGPGGGRVVARMSTVSERSAESDRLDKSDGSDQSDT
jgi:tRNA threonylcarbamoyladenosine biosynthesis protein TsaE